MPSNKFKTRFPPARIKKIMQTDEEVGKLSCAVPVIVSKSVELFTEILLHKSGEIALGRGARTLSIDHIKQCVEQEHKFDFLREIVREAAAKAIGKSGEDVANSGQNDAGSSANEEGDHPRSKDSLSPLRRTKSQQPQSADGVPHRPAFSFPSGNSEILQPAGYSHKHRSKGSRPREAGRNFDIAYPVPDSVNLSQTPDIKRKAILGNVAGHASKTSKGVKRSGTKVERFDAASFQSRDHTGPSETVPNGRPFPESQMISEPSTAVFPNQEEEYASSSHYSPYHMERMPLFSGPPMPEFSYPNPHVHFPYNSPPPSMIRMPHAPPYLDQSQIMEDLSSNYYGTEPFRRDHQMMMYGSPLDYSNPYSTDEPTDLHSSAVVQDLSRKRPLDLSDHHSSLNSYDLYGRYGS